MTSPATAGIGFDPADPGFRADPHAFYRELRERAPVLRLAHGGWAVTGYTEVRSLLRDPRLRPRREAPPAIGTPAGTPLLRAQKDAERLLGAFMSDRAEADHARLRRLVMPAFSPGRVADRRARIQAFVDERIERALSRGRMDVVGELGRPLAMTVIAELVGIPEAMLPKVQRYARELVHRIDLWSSAAGRERAALASVGLMASLRGLISGVHERPLLEGSLLAALERSRGEGAVSEDEVIAQCAVLLVVGHVTTEHLIGIGMLSLLRRPDEWRALRENPDLIETAVEELLRHDTSAPVVPCAAFEDVEIAGETIRRGESVLLLIAAANRDPTVFPAPDRLDIRRSPNPHLGFGYGAHHCVGTALGRLEAQVAIGTLARRLPAARLATKDLEWEDTFIFRGLKSLPIVLED